MNQDDNQPLTATQARTYAKLIAEECSECFEEGKVKAKKEFGKWVITINGGSQACYGRTISTEDAAIKTLRIFANDRVN